MAVKMQELYRIRSSIQTILKRSIHSTDKIPIRPKIQSETKPDSSTFKILPRNRSEEKNKIDPNTVDLVGPPDSISNIRPMIYAPTQTFNRSKIDFTISSTDRASNPHPYSLHEFHQTAKNDLSNVRRKPKGLGVFQMYRQYVDHVCDRVEELDLKFRLNKLTIDSTTQRFWRDNNSRFNRDMKAWIDANLQEGSSHHLIKSNNRGNSSEKLPTMEGDLNSMSSCESDFYATWLKANAKRNKAYNVLVWKQAFNQIRLGAQVKLWTSWFGLLRRLEG